MLTSGAQKSAGGMDTLYLGYNLDMAREFIDACAMWAQRLRARAASAVEEFLFQEQDEKGADRAIQAFRITFASGFEIVALSSRPRSLRGRQGFVILDEFAFHDDADELLKAAMALLIWGGKVLVISTHNGADNPFNELIEEIRVRQAPQATSCELHLRRRAGAGALSAHLPGDRQAVVAGGGGRSGAPRSAASTATTPPRSWTAFRRRAAGVYLTGALIEACMTPAAPVLRLTCPQGFELQARP